MSIIRKREASDVGALRALCDSLGFDDLSNFPEDVYVVEDRGELVALLRIKDCGGVSYLSEVGVHPERRGEGLAMNLLNDILGNIDSDVYLYTVIPDFFKRFGFRVADIPPSIPTRGEIDCEGCEVSKCRCMVRWANDS